MTARVAVTILCGLSLHAATFYEDVLPIFEKHCLACHRDGGIAPMRFDSYEATRPWVKAIREAVVSKKMPPWLADLAYGRFSNERRLNSTETQTIQSWALSGAAEGRRRFARVPVSGPWDLGKPDWETSLPIAVSVPARGQLEYRYIVLPQRFERETWVQAVEIRPSVASVVHHAVLYIREAGSTWTHGPTTNDILAVYTPGNTFDRFPAGMAKRIPAGADLLLQVHYTPDGKPRSDRTRVGLQFARERPRRAILTLQLNNSDFRIPPGDGNYRVRTAGTLPNDALLLSLFPHMHLRGKAFEYAITASGGQYETLLRVPRYDFHWQLNYKLAEPRLLRAGTRLEATAWYDNSANNPRNPDPNAEVGYGEQSWEEMMIGFFDVAVDASIDKKAFFLRP
jgi:hypothetical protein